MFLLLFYLQSCRRGIVNAIVPWTTAQNFGVRCTAVAALRLILHLLKEEEKGDEFALLESIAFFDAEPAG